MKNIASERHRLDMSQAALAGKLGVSSNTVSRWEQDEDSISARHLIKMSRLFSCSIDYLLGLTEVRGVQS